MILTAIGMVVVEARLIAIVTDIITVMTIIMVIFNVVAMVTAIAMVIERSFQAELHIQPEPRKLQLTDYKHLRITFLLF